MTSERIEIGYNKTKGSIISLICFLVAIASIFAIQNADNQNYFNAFQFIVTSYSILILFGGIGILILFYTLLNKKPLLIIDKNGLYIDDNNVGISGRTIEWGRIKNIKTDTKLRIDRRATIKLILVNIKDPEAFFEFTTAYEEEILRLNFKTFGTPVTIEGSNLDYNFDELFELINKHIKP